MELRVFDLGLVDFGKAWQFQRKVLSQVKAGLLDSALIFCRHNPVITLGRSASKANIIATAEELQERGIELYEIERGGDVTYHGPGQLTIYPILNLEFLKKDIHWYLRSLEDIIIDCLEGFGVKSHRRQGLTGIWIGDKKIASIGISIKNWITFHGLSINVKKDDLVNFKLIRPCGMDIQMVSLEDVLSKSMDTEDIKEGIVKVFGDTFAVSSGFGPRLNPETSHVKEEALL